MVTRQAQAMGGGDRLFQANPSKFGPQPPAILYATQPTKDTVDGTEASVEMQSSLNGAESDVLMNTAVVVVEKSALTQDVVRMIKATLQVQHCDIACLVLVSFLFLSRLSAPGQAWSVTRCGRCMACRWWHREK